MYIIISLIFLTNLNSYATSQSNKYRLFDDMNQKYLSSNFDEIKYMNQWINVRYNDKTIHEDNQYVEFAKDIIDYMYDKSLFVGLVKLKRFKFCNFKKDDNERLIEEEVEIIEVYKGEQAKLLSYFVSLETDDTYFAGKVSSTIIFVYKIDGKLYKDTLSTLLPTKEVIKILKDKSK